MNEGPGHVPLNKIPENMAKQLDWCRWGALFKAFRGSCLERALRANMLFSHLVAAD
jgi:hypothetical protein